MDKVIKKYNLKCMLIDKQTKKAVALKNVEIYGTCGNEAVSKYMLQLAKEGLYELDESYSYSEIGTLSSN